MKKNTITAILKHLNNGEHSFHIGGYYYEADIDYRIRRREQVAGRLPTSDWELVGYWDFVKGAYYFVEK